MFHSKCGNMLSPLEVSPPPYSKIVDISGKEGSQKE